MNNDALQNLNINKRYVRLGIAGVAVLLVLIIIHSLWTTGTLKLTALTPTPGNAKVTATIKQGNDTQTVQLTAGKTTSLRLKNGTVRVDSQVGNIKSVDVVTIKGFSTTSLRIPAGEDRAAVQVAQGVRYCPVANESGSIYSYNCNGEGAIAKHTGNSSAFIMNGLLFSNLQPIKGGLIGFSSDDPHRLLFVDLSSEVPNQVPVPTAIQNLIQKESPNIVTSNDQSSGQFALVFSRKNAIYLFQNTGDTNPEVITPPKGINLFANNRSSSITLNGSKLLVYAGAAGTGDVDEGVIAPGDGKDKSSKVRCQLFEYATSTGRLSATIDMPYVAGSRQLYTLGNNFYAAQQVDTFELYHHDQTGIRSVYSMPDIAGWTIADGKTYIQAGGTLFQFTPKSNGQFSLQSRFRQSNIVVSGVFNTQAGLLFTAFAGTDSEAPLNAYRLLPAGQAAPKPLVAPRANYSGLDDLLQYGISTDQRDTLKNAFATYAVKNNITISRILATSITSEYHDPASDDPFVTLFDAKINNDVLPTKARIEYSGFNSLRLYLYDYRSGAQLFDSQNP